MELTIGAANQGLGDSVFVMNKVKRESSFHAQVAVVERLAGFGASDFDQSIVVRVQIHLTTNATKVASRPRGRDVQLDQVLWALLFNECPCRASVDAPAAQFAAGIDQAPLSRRRDRGLGSTVGQRDRVDPFDFIAVASATSTQDAQVGFEFDVRIVVGRSSVPRGVDRGELHWLDGFAELAKLVVVFGFDRKACGVQFVVGHVQVVQNGPVFFDAVRFGCDLHVGRHHPRAAGLQTTLAFDFDQANATRARWSQSIVVA